ncbi:MAG: hypothetical protein R6X06_03515 [Gammaproteobacteria bacterium]
MYLPKTLYEALPFLYATCSIATISILDSPLAILSGSALGFAGILIYSLRRRHRLARVTAP